MNFKDYFPTFPELRLRRITLRELRETDAKDLFDYYHNANVCRFLDWDGPDSPEKAIEAIRFWMNGIPVRSGSWKNAASGVKGN